jgi:hypothetical protein
MNDETKAKEAYVEAGVELPELETKAEEPKVEPTEPAKPEADKEAPEPEEPKAPLATEPTEPKPRTSIYDEYKEKKAELKTEKEAREQAERERDDLKVKLEAVSTAVTPEEKKEAQDELDTFAAEINADPATIRKLRDLIIKDLPGNALSDEDRQILDEARANRERTLFDREYEANIPTVKQMFANADDAELSAIKAKVDEISHTPEFAKTTLDYVIFKNKDMLEALVSPKKRGLEPKSRRDNEAVTSDFDPNADISKMTAAEQEQWEKDYQALGKNEGLATDGQGRKIFI